MGGLSWALVMVIAVDTTACCDESSAIQILEEQFSANIVRDATKPGMPVVEVTFSTVIKRKITEIAIKELVSFKQLEKLALLNAEITPEAWKLLPNLVQLRRLEL